MSREDLDKLFEAAARNPRKELFRMFTARTSKHAGGSLNAYRNQQVRGFRPAAKWVPQPRPHRSG